MHDTHISLGQNLTCVPVTEHSLNQLCKQFIHKIANPKFVYDLPSEDGIEVSKRQEGTRDQGQPKMNLESKNAFLVAKNLS